MSMWVEGEQELVCKQGIQREQKLERPPKGGTGKTSEAMKCIKDLVSANLQIADYRLQIYKLRLWVERDCLGAMGEL